MACPLWPVHLIFLYIMALFPFWFMFTGIAAAAAEASWWNLTFSPEKVEQLVEDTNLTIHFWSHQPLGSDFRNGRLEISVSDEKIAGVGMTRTNHSDNGHQLHGQQQESQPHKALAASPSVGSPLVIFLNTSDTLTTLPLNLSFALHGRFLGYTDVRVRAMTSSLAAKSKLLESDPLAVSVVRPPRVVDKVFVYAVAILMALNYINMGSSLDLDVVKNTLRRPVGPAVGLLSQYLFMPLIAFGLSYAFFDVPALRLGLFTSGCSPGGGASNMWTYLLNGNLSLSITMTFFSNVFAFATMPLWLFTLGGVVFQDNKINIPYMNIVSYVVALVFPVGIGILLQLYLRRLAAVCRRILGPFSIAMILFIVVFGVYTNLFMFRVFTWQIFCAGLLVPFFGYVMGATVACLLGFPAPDVKAISVETGVQNTGVAIVLLRLTLPQPEADLTTVVPIALATMTPIPLLLALIVVRVRKHINRKRNKQYTLAATSSPTPSDEEVHAKLSPGAVSNGTSSAVPTITINGSVNRTGAADEEEGLHY